MVIDMIILALAGLGILFLAVWLHGVWNKLMDKMAEMDRMKGRW